jgi:hypothetical protein
MHKYPGGSQSLRNQEPCPRHHRHKESSKNTKGEASLSRNQTHVTTDIKNVMNEENMHLKGQKDPPSGN